MARYDVYETGFDNLNETQYFGKRAIDGKSLYEICTLAVIRSSDAISKSCGARIKATSYYEVNGSIYLGIGNCLRILHSIDAPDLLAMHEFDDNVDGISVSSCGRFLLICTQDGQIYISDLAISQDQSSETKESVCSELSFIFTTKVECALQSNTENFYLTVFTDETSKVPTFYAVTCTGLVEKITRILDETNGEHFVCEQVYDSKQNIHIAAIAYPYLCMEGTELVILDLRSMDCQIDDAFGIKSLHSSGPNFLAFDKNGNMYTIDSARCLVFGVNNVFPVRLSDFEQLWFIGSGDKQIIVAVTKHQDIQAFRSLTDSDAIYDIHLEHPVHLNNNIKGYTEEIAFLSEVYKNETLVELRLQIITTTDPEVRVRKLIDQGQIEKAEFFAAQFNVDPECIAQVKAFNIITKSECTSEDIDKFLSILDSMKNGPLRLELCDAVVCKTGEDTRRVLRHAALSEINAEDSKNNSNTILMRREFSAKLRKFDTYMNVYKEYNQQQWSSFVDCDLIEEVKKFLGQGCIEEATVLVLSGLYSAELAAALTDVKVKEVMSTVNEQSLEANKSFLNAFIPLTLTYKPDAIEIFVEWMCNRAIQMEKYIDFPDCAIRFLKDISSIIMHSPPQCHLDKAREKLLHLRQALENIQKLEKNFQVHLPLKDCLDGPNAIVSTLLNVCIMMNCDPTKLRLLMNEFLYPFILECQEHPDIILLNEIQSFFNIEEAYWLDTAYVLLEFISKVNQKLSIIKDILIRTSKPWSDKVKKIVSLAFNHSTANPMTEELSSLLKNEQFLILLEKYNINENNFVSWEDKEFYYRRILYLNIDDCDRAFNDIRQLCAESDQFQADYLMMREFVFRGHAEEAFILMDKMEPEYICILGSRLLHDTCFKTRKFLSISKLRDIFYKALGPLWNRLKRHCNSRELDAVLDDYNTTRAMYWMHINFKMEITQVDMTPKLEANTIAICLNEINLEPEIEFNTIIEHCKTLSSFFGRTLDTVLLQYINICDHFERFLKIGEYLLEVSQSPQILTQCAVNILKCLQRESDSMENKTFFDTAIVETATNGNSDDVAAVQLARNLCVKAALCHVDRDKITLTSIVEVLRLIDCHFNLGAIGGELDVDLDIHHACLRSPIFSLTATMTMMFNMHAACKGSFLHGYCSFFKPDQWMNVEDVSKGLETFIWNTRAVLNQKQQLIAFNMIKLVQQTSLILPESHKDILKALDNFLMESVLPQTMEALLAEKYMDTNIVLRLMVFYDNDSLHQHIVKYLRLYKKQPAKVHVIAQLSLEALNYKEIQFDKKHLVDIVNVCKWWFRFKDSKIKYASFFHGTPKARLEVLMKEEIVTVNHLPEYCADFEMDLQTCYFKYLKTLLLNWRPNITYTTEINGNRSIKIQNSEQELLDKCVEVLNCISDLNGVFNLTTNLWNSVNSYYYEVYLALLDIHHRVAPSNGTISELYGPLLYFLKTYGRVSKPTRTEIEMWCGANPLKPLIDPLSEFRLPLTSTFLSNEIWTIIKPEVNLDTYKQWFKLADFLSQYLKKQDICFYAITSPISSGLIDTACSTWELSLKYDFLLFKVENCAYSMDNLEHATAAVYNLMGQMPNGADKVELAKLSYKFAKLYWESTTDQTVKQTFVKVKQRYFNYSASHILHKYQLADVKYLELVAQPSDLISELYSDPRIESYYDNVVLQCPGINSAVEDLCSLFQLNVLVECKRVLVEFLSSDFHINLQSRLQHGNGSIELIRASYLCKSEHLTYWQKYLVKLGFNDSEDNEMVFRANALRCFYHISSVDTIEQMCNMTHDEFVNYLSKVSIIAKLANLGIKYESVTKLDEENQKRLLRNLAKLNNPLAIQCIAAISTTYGFNDLKYWEYIVNMASQFKMYDDLRGYLQFLSNRCIHDYVKKAWYVVLNHAFNNCKWEAFSEAEIYLLIQNCPIYELDFEPYIEECINNQRPDLANILKDITNKPI